MSDILDTLGDLAHSAYDTVTGAFSSKAPNKPGYTAEDASHHMGSGIADKGASLVTGRQAQIDQAVKDAGG